MTKRFCDICGKEVVGLAFSEDLKNHKFSIASNGRLWDICNKCREDLVVWMKNRKECPEREYEEVGTGELYPGEFESRHYDFEEDSDGSSST